MFDFSDYLENITGTFPDVEAIDCSGPYETDGTELIAVNLFNDCMFGWIQALMTDAGLTPNGVAETSSASQIVDAMRTLNAKTIVPLTEFVFTDDYWKYESGYLLSNHNTGFARCGFDLPTNMRVDLTITVNVDPGAARTGNDRMMFDLVGILYDGTTEDIGWASSVFDDGSSNKQDVVLQINGLNTNSYTDYELYIWSGSTGASDLDKVYGVKKEFVLSE